jgi:serine/threonine-protein kinase
MQGGDILLERYRLDELLGEGGFGAVWRATDHALDRAVAIKFLHTSDEDALRRFRREARALGHLRHPNCLQLFAFDATENGVPFLVRVRAA